MNIKQKLKHSLFFALFAFLTVPTILIITGIVSGSPSMGFKFIIRHDGIYIPFILIPAVVAYISAFGLVNNIKYDSNKQNNNRKSWITTSLLIVVLSLFLWACIMFFMFQSQEKWMGFELAFYAGILYSPVIYPLGLLAGYIVWRLNKKKYLPKNN